MKTQVCEVNKTLLSVSRMMETGIPVVFDKKGSYVQDVETGVRLYLNEKGGMYFL